MLPIYTDYNWSCENSLPDRATRSVKSIPLLVNCGIITASVSKGLGISLLAPDRFAVKLSFLPKSTCHDGPLA